MQQQHQKCKRLKHTLHNKTKQTKPENTHESENRHRGLSHHVPYWLTVGLMLHCIAKTSWTIFLSIALTLKHYRLKWRQCKGRGVSFLAPAVTNRFFSQPPSFPKNISSAVTCKFFLLTHKCYQINKIYTPSAASSPIINHKRYQTR